jgi:hypothetical protein
MEPDMSNNVISFPRTRPWSASRIAALNRELDVFDARARAISTHPEHADQDDRYARWMSLYLAISPERSAWFWPADLSREVDELVARLGLSPDGRKG